MRKSISTAFFSMVSTLMVLGIVLMGCSEWVLFKNYFAKDRYETLDQVVNVAKRTAEYLVNSETMPQGAELDALNTKLEIIGESAEAYLFFTDRQGNVLIASDPDKLTTTTVPLDICQRANAVADPDARHYHAFGDLGGALTEKSYIAAVETIDDQSLFSGWLFLCSSGAQLTDFKQQFWSNFLMSACVMLLCASVLTRLLMRQLTDPLQKVTDAAQRFGGGDLSVRVEGVEGDGEVADLARTFNQMAENIQSNIRQLEGAVKKIKAMHELMGERITVSLAENAIDALRTENPGLNPTPERIMEAVANYFYIPVEQMISQNRSKDVAYPRQMAMYMIRQELEYSFPDIAKIFKRDHTTVMHACNKIEEERKKSRQTEDVIKKLHNNIRGD